MYYDEKKKKININDYYTFSILTDYLLHIIYSLYEVLRLHPSVPNNQKYALNDDIWPDGTQIKKGD